MKSFTGLILVLFILLLGISYGDTKTETRGAEIKAFVQNFLLSSSADKVNWAVTIEDYSVSMKEISDGFNFIMKQLPEDQKKMIADTASLKKKYLNDAIMEYVILQKAMQENLFDEEDARGLLKAALKKTIMQVYINKFVPKDQTKFIPTKEEISDFYNKNREQFDSTGASADQIKTYITQQLTQQKMQTWMVDFLEKSKEQFKIKRNLELLEKEGFN